jgi:hypothetical protein
MITDPTPVETLLLYMGPGWPSSVPVPGACYRKRRVFQSSPMPSKVFISYRHDDARYQARWIYEAFSQVMPREHIFMDVDSRPSANM